MGEIHTGRNSKWYHKVEWVKTQRFQDGLLGFRTHGGQVRLMADDYSFGLHQGVFIIRLGGLTLGFLCRAIAYILFGQLKSGMLPSPAAVAVVEGQIYLKEFCMK